MSPYPVISRLAPAGLLLAALVALALPAGGRSRAAPLAAGRNTLVVARDLSDLRTLDPGRLFEPSAGVVAGNAYDTLVTVQGEDVTHLRPSLAARWTAGRADRVYTFYLRPGVRFSNGDPLTAADVVFSYRRLGYLLDNPAYLMGAHTAGKRVVIDQVRALGSHTVQFVLPASDASFPAALTTPTFGVLDARVVRARGGNDSPHAATSDKATPWLDGHSIGTGAYVLRSWTRGGTGQVVLTRNPYYWGPRPFLNRVVFQGIPSATTQRFEVERGTVDIASNVSSDAVKSLRQDGSVSVLTGNTLDLIYLAMTTRSRVSRPLSNIKVRQAIRAALDYHGIIGGLLRGIGTQPNSMIPVGSIGNDPVTNSTLKTHTDLALARRLMRQAGYPGGFSVTMKYPAGFTFDGVSFDVLAPKVVYDLGAIGIKVTPVALPLSVLLPAWRAARQGPLMLFAYDPAYPDPDDYASAFGSGGFNGKHVGYTWDPHMAELAREADSTSDVSRRAALYRQIQQLWLKEGPWAAVVQPRGIIVLHRGVTNYRFSPVYPGNLRVVHKG
jgi:peptide/nickel transport system substrate-binding protein